MGYNSAINEAKHGSSACAVDNPLKFMDYLCVQAGEPRSHDLTFVYKIIETW